ncbi:MepB family protein [Amycolatopsis sp. WAC 01375]|uniref:MepB family protein n=1 Tax=Amycolatopsis sp. WAC 01375 TaxID=2203194 RepID=UPI0018F5D01E|nr:MepB family protein [Amycolatopsis sp. WAC 01375]
MTIDETGDGTTHRWATDPALGDVPVQLVESVREVFEDSGLVVTRPAVREVESAEYGACRLAVDDRSIAFRVAKTTPTKVGQFVTMWTRADPDSEIAPFDTSDSISSAVIAVFNKDHRGLFIFNSRELVRRGIMSAEGKGGKRAMRVYAPWVQVESKQAVRTKRWQVERFVQIQPRIPFTPDLLRQLLREDCPDL